MTLEKFSYILSNIKVPFQIINYNKHQILNNASCNLRYFLLDLHTTIGRIFNFPVEVSPLPILVEDTGYVEDNKQLLEDSIMWAAPKKRRCIEKRRTRRMGNVNQVLTKLYQVKTLHTCLACGGPHEIGRLCPNCYSKVKEVTTEIQSAMKKHNGLNAIEEDFFPIFKGEKVNSEDGYFEGKRVLEVDVERPHFFSKNLMKKSNVSLSDEVQAAISDPLHIK